MNYNVFLPPDGAAQQSPLRSWLCSVLLCSPLPTLRAAAATGPRPAPARPMSELNVPWDFSAALSNLHCVH